LTTQAYKNLAQMVEGKKLVFGHRGAKAYAPMNTLPAFELALEQGAEGVELDVHLTKDGQLVIVHDFSVDRTSNGSGLVADFTLEEIQSLDAGAWFDARFKGVRIPTLDEVFEQFGQDLLFNVEIKYEAEQSNGIEYAVRDLIIKHNMQSRVVVSSFHPGMLQWFRAIDQEIPLGFLTMSGNIEEYAALDCEAYHPYDPLIDDAYVRTATAQNRFVNTWTVNDPARAKQLFDLGVNVVITDQPDVIRAVLGS